MKRLSRHHENVKTRLVDDLSFAKANVEDAVAAVNTVIEERLNLAINNYNMVIADVSEFKDMLLCQMTDYLDAKGERWHGNDRANYAIWRSDWGDLDTYGIDNVDEIEVPDMNHGDELEALKNEAD